jgi:GNAT superfamily N-acetyltransferase
MRFSATYWAESRPREITEAAMRHSVCLGIFHAGRQVGFARAVTDHATFTWICDVVIDPGHRGRGLGKRLMECLLAHPALQTVTHLLRTRDAHGLYQPFGFQRVECLRRSLAPP